MEIWLNGAMKEEMNEGQLDRCFSSSLRSICIISDTETSVAISEVGVQLRNESLDRDMHVP